LIVRTSKTKLNQKGKKMQYNMMELKSNLPELRMDSVMTLNLVDRYMNYKQEMKRIEYEMDKLEYQTQIIITNIDAQLSEALDSNQKNFDLEMSRIKQKGKNLKAGQKQINEVLKSIRQLTKQLCDPATSLDEKKVLLTVIKESNATIQLLQGSNTEQMNEMTNFNPNRLIAQGK